MRIVLTGGGTGGHIFPLLAVSHQLRALSPGCELTFIGPRGRLEAEFIEKEGIKIKEISVGKMRRYFSFQNFTDAIKVLFGIIQSLFWLLVVMPDAVFSKGGYASFPVVFVSWIYRIPVLIHDSDAKPGLANVVLEKLADRVAISYANAARDIAVEKTVLTGNPIREDINQGQAERVYSKFGLTHDRKLIFVWGGSQGAKIINDKVVDILPHLLKKYQVIHQTGEDNVDEVNHRAGQLGIKAGHDGYYAVPFIAEDLKDVLAAADLVISRAGANSIAEIAANAKPSILIPIDKSANDHQRMNAYEVAKVGGAIVLDESNLGENMLSGKVEELMEKEELRRKLSENIRPFYHPNAAKMLAEGIIGLTGN